MIEFQVSTRWTGERRIIKVMVYDDLGQMRRATRKRDAFFGVARQPDAYKALGATTSFEVVNERPCTTIRLARGHTDAGMIAHEAVHAAFRLHEHDVQKTIPHKNEETFCYIVGDLVQRITRKLDDYGYVRSIS